MLELIAERQILREEVTLNAEETDRLIINNIDRATAENSSIWTSPDYNKREYIHSFFQYPGRMIPAVQRKLIEIITEAKPEIRNMIDPFMGSATTLVACMESGLNCYGQDINPLSILIGKARTGPIYIKGLREKYEDLMKRLENDNNNQIEASFKTLNKWFKPNISQDLSKLVRAIRSEPLLLARRFFWVVLSETIRVSSNDRTSTYKLHIRKQEEIDRRTFSAIDVFALHIDKCIEDYELHANLLSDHEKLLERTYIADVDIKLCDSKSNIRTPTGKPFYHLLVTSPPYGDNKTTVTYGQSSFLPLQWIDLIDIDEEASEEFLKSTLEIDSRSLGGKLKDVDQKNLENLFQKSPSFQAIYQQIKNKSKKLTPKVIGFISDLNKTLDNIFSVMLPDSYQVWTLGNRSVAQVEVPNDKIVTELIESKGGRLIKKLEREIINKRMAKKNKDTSLMNTEDILIFRKIGRSY